MTDDTTYDWKKNIPVQYATVLENYGYPNQVRDYSAADLITIWRAAIAAYKSAPEQRNNIAIETVSMGSYAELTDTDARYNDIHYKFGILEVPAGNTDAPVWKQLEADIEELAKNIVE